MKSLKTYDPPMCCSTGICGPDLDPDLVDFAAMLSQLAAQGTLVQRYNLGQQPMAFVENSAVKALLDSDGTDALPIVFVDDIIFLKGRYPSREERSTLIRMAFGKKSDPAL